MPPFLQVVPLAFCPWPPVIVVAQPAPVPGAAQVVLLLPPLWRAPPACEPSFLVFPALPAFETCFMVVFA